MKRSIFAVACLVATFLHAEFVLVNQGQPAATVVVSEPEGTLSQVAQTFIDYIYEATGARLTLSTTPPADGNMICIGETAKQQGAVLPAELDGDGYAIQFPQPGVATICGPTAWGTEFGVYEFLERFVGVRWLLPGKDGTDIPKQSSLKVPAREIIQQPLFFSRLLSGLRGGEQALWARRNRMHGRVSFHHNLINLFPPKTYTTSHPEFFPVKKGTTTRYLPATNTTHGWQPCFSAPGSVDEAARIICEYFDAHPEAQSYSLGTNDSSGFCHCEKCQGKIGKEKNFLGREDYSDLYFSWANQVIDKVLEKHPDKRFGCLAYSEVANPPTKVKVHPRLIPYMTYDRMKWNEPSIRAGGEAATRAWHAQSPVVGWYDYIYGSPYCLPRVWFHQMAEYYRFGYDNGVRALYAEAYPNFGEGPKLYVALKLQWDPNADVDTLLDEWYERCVGAAAATHLKEYYNIWEDFWTRRILQSSWFSERGQYLRFSHPGYLADVDLDKDISRSRHLLETALAKAGTPAQKTRAQLLLSAFEYYEASAYAYRADDLKADSPEKLLDAISKYTAHAARRRELATKVFPGNPVLQHPLDIDRFPAVSGKSWGSSALWKLYDAIVAAPPGSELQRKVEAMTGQQNPVGEQLEMMLVIKNKKKNPINENPSFENGNGNAADGWTWWVKWQTGSMYRTDEMAHSGEWSLCFDGMRRGGPVQNFPISPGRYGLVCSVFAPENENGSVELAMTMRDDKGANLPSASTTMIPPPGRWTTIAVVQTIPAELRGKKVATVMPMIIPTGFGPAPGVEGDRGKKVFVDDLILFKLD